MKIERYETDYGGRLSERFKIYAEVKRGDKIYTISAMYPFDFSNKRNKEKVIKAMEKQINHIKTTNDLPIMFLSNKQEVPYKAL